MKEMAGASADDALKLEIAVLKKGMAEINRRLEALETAGGRFINREDYEPISSGDIALKLPDEEGLWSWLGKNAVLPRVAAACFMLVVALLLRTATDNSWVSPNPGTMLGLSYVALLLLAGWRQYAASHNLAPVFTGCGMLLLFSIIAESRFHFSVLPAWLGASLLTVGTAATVLVAISYRAPILLWLASLGALAVIFILDFPNIVFPVAAVILLLSVLAAITAARRELSKGLRWPILLGVFFLFSIWGFKLSHAVRQVAGGADLSSIPPSVFAVWFLPLLLCFVLLFIGMTGDRLLRGKDLDAFDHLMPLSGVILLLLGGNVTIVTWGERPVLMGLIAMGTAFSLLTLIRHKRITQKSPDTSGFASFGLAAALLLFSSFPFLTDDFAKAQILLPLGFILFLFFSRHLENGNLRLVSVFLAFITMATGLLSGVYTGQPKIGPANWLAVFTAATAGLGAYFWCRRNPPARNGFFGFADPNDYLALTFLVHGLLGMYYLAALTLARLFAVAGLAPASLACGRSILINFGAALLIVWGALLKKEREIATTGIVVALIGGGKVFFSDLLNASGLPLVLSVSSFGALAALCSLVLSNWQKISQTAKEH